MGRLIRVVLYAVVVLILYFWVVSLLKSYKQGQELKNAEVKPTSDSLGMYAQDTLYEPQEDLFGDSNITEGEQVYEKIDQRLEQMSEGSEKKATIKTQQPKTQTEQNTHQKVANNGTQGGKYMVIAGSFIKEENARDQLRKLKSIGYQGAEIKIFVASEYHSVIVSRHSQPQDAERVVEDLKKKGVESFVKEKRE